MRTPGLVRRPPGGGRFVHATERTSISQVSSFPGMSFPHVWSFDPWTSVPFMFSLASPEGGGEEQAALLVRSFSLF